MSNAITFIEPNGLDVTNPEPNLIEEAIYNKGDKYWQSNAGDAAFWFDEDDQRKADLVVVSKEPYGFRLEYQSYVNDADYVLIDGDNSSETIIAIVGGNETSFPRNQFVPKDTAWSAISHFMKTGEPLESLRWQA